MTLFRSVLTSSSSGSGYENVGIRTSPQVYLARVYVVDGGVNVYDLVVAIDGVSIPYQPPPAQSSDASLTCLFSSLLCTFVLLFL